MEAADLEQYRDAIATLHRDGSHVGYLATSIEPVQSGSLLRRNHRVWLLLTGLDGPVDIQEDYAPWTYINDMRDGHIDWSWFTGPDAGYEVRWLSGEERDRAWSQYGLVDEVGTYMGRRTRR